MHGGGRYFRSARHRYGCPFADGALALTVTPETGALEATVPVGPLRLRAERLGGGDGRVCLIVAKATDESGNTGVAAASVVVPRSNAAQWRNQVAAVAQAAKDYALSNGGAPPDTCFVSPPVVSPPP